MLDDPIVRRLRALVEMLENRLADARPASEEEIAAFEAEIEDIKDEVADRFLPFGHGQLNVH